MSKPILAAILSCSGTELTDAEKRLFATYNPLGISLFARNIKNKEQIKKLIEEIKNTVNRDDVLIAVDEEGGRVSRLQPIFSNKRVSAEDLGQAPIKYSKMHAILTADDMHSLGINVNFAPVVEKKTSPQSMVLKTRCFSSNARAIMNRAKLISSVYITQGICPCLKHLPGHLGLTSDPHLHILETETAKAKIKKEISYLKEYKDYPLAMTAHVILKSVDKDNPVSMSKKCVSEIIRGYLNYDNFLISDAIDMHALSGSIVEKTMRCLNAGLDAVCYCGGQEKDLYGICRQKYFLAEKSLIRFANIKKVIHNTYKTTDIYAIEKEYQKKFQEHLNIKYEYDATEVLNQMLKQGESI